MGIRIELDGTTGRVAVGDEATIAHAAEFRDALVKASELADNVVIDFGDLQTVDLTCLQLICAAHRSLSERKKEMRLEGSGLAALRSAADAAGFPRECGCIPGSRKEQCVLRQGF